MAAEYQHAPLPTPRSFRVLRLEPSTDRAALLRCSLVTVSMDMYEGYSGNYTALSYSWNAQSPSIEISCDGASLLVTPSCERAMRELRDQQDSRLLWIDSVCINQHSDALAERSAQVAMMSDIYKTAKKVVVWLGEHDPEVAAGIVQLMNIAKQDGSSRERRAVQRHAQMKVQALSEAVRTGTKDPLGPFFDLSWFHRMWTVQEATLALLDRLVLRIGSVEIPWGLLIVAVDALSAVTYRWARWREAMLLQRELAIYLAAKRYKGVKAILDDNPGDVHNDPLAFSILINARRKKASDPKDKIFALYGVLTELEVPFSPPDYTRAVEDIYRDSVVSCINYDKNLYVLYHAPSDCRRASLASWVPDWSEPGWDEGDSRYGLLRGRFAASKGAPARWKFARDNEALILTGKVVDTVIFRADALPEINTLAAALSGGGHDSPDAQRERYAGYLKLNHRAYLVLKEWIDLSQWSDYPTGEPLKKAFQRTVVNDNPQCNADAAKNNCFDRWFDSMTRDVAASGQLNSTLQALAASSNELAEASRSFSALQGPGFPFHSDAMSFSQRKCFFRTEGGYFGTCPDPLPASMQDGDKIVLVSGLEQPLMLRPVEGAYKLLTHCYVHGMMSGEAWPKRERDLEEIVLI